MASQPCSACRRVCLAGRLGHDSERSRPRDRSVRTLVAREPARETTPAKAELTREWPGELKRATHTAPIMPNRYFHLPASDFARPSTSAWRNPLLAQRLPAGQEKTIPKQNCRTAWLNSAMVLFCLLRKDFSIPIKMTERTSPSQKDCIPSANDPVVTAEFARPSRVPFGISTPRRSPTLADFPTVR